MTTFQTSHLAERILAVVVLMVVARTNESRADNRISSIVDNVRQNEALYDEVDVSLHTEYSIGDRKPAKPKEPNRAEIVSSSIGTKFVKQNGHFRLDMSGSNFDGLNRQLSRDRIRAFDGTTTRLYDQKSIGNIIKGISVDDNFVYPHMIMLRFIQFPVKLSTYLSGQDVMKSAPSVNWDDRHKLEYSYQGEELFDKLKCHKIWITTVISGIPNDRWELWLAEDRNYIPVRMLGFTFRISRTMPVSEGVVSEFRQVKPGIWFPFVAKIISYDQMLMQIHSEKSLRWEYNYVISNVSLDPKYDPSYFRDVKFPDGTAVYEIEDNKIKRSYIEGAPNSPNPRLGVKSWLVVSNAVLIGMVGSVLLFRKIRNRSR